MTRALVILLLATACQRERRQFDSPDPRPATSSPQLSLVPGEPPVAGAELDQHLPDYAETAQAISDGKQLYAYYNCVGCHAHGGGNIGPALMDDAWKYGNKPGEIATSIIGGRPMGMPSYRGKIAPRELASLVAYVRALGGLARGDATSPRDEHEATR